MLWQHLKGWQLESNYRRCLNFSLKWIASSTLRQGFNFSLCSSLSPHVACFSLHKSRACLGCHAKRNQWYARLNKFRIPSKAQSLSFFSGIKNRDASKKTFSVEKQGMLELYCLVRIWNLPTDEHALDTGDFLPHWALDNSDGPRLVETDLTSRVLGSTLALIVPPFVFQLV